MPHRLPRPFGRREAPRGEAAPAYWVHAGGAVARRGAVPGVTSR
ncbi:hypothetical protein STXM2123_4362 [Streptomyces sp. F-3]|nr:hypothetical protein STXM2123_4362 [Streptomyces sp. F-3]